MTLDRSEPTPGFEGLTDLVLDRDAEVPIGVQLAWALRTRIRDGRFIPGQRLPALRDLAEALGVNANTVRAVYQRLEHEGIIASQQGSGTFVADLTSAPSAVGSIAALAAQEAHDTGVDPRDVAAALYVEQSSGGSPADAQASRKRQLRAQIAALELTLGELAARQPALARKPVGGASDARPRLLDMAELERTKAELVAQLAALHAAVEGLGRERTAAEGSSKAGARSREGDAAKAGASKTADAPKRAARTRAKTRPAPAGA